MGSCYAPPTVDTFEPLPPFIGFLLSALYPLISIAAWIGALVAAWRHQRERMAVLVGIAMVAMAATIARSVWT